MKSALKFQGQTGITLYDIVIKPESIIAFEYIREVLRVYLIGGQKIDILASQKNYEMLVKAIEG